jgi:hypothetical protein
VSGGPGADRLFGLTGADTLDARDGEADLEIDCGEDSDPWPDGSEDTDTVFYDVGIDPTPINCEIENPPAPPPVPLP